MLSGAAAGREVPLVKVVTTIGKPGVAVAAITKRSHGFVVAHVEGSNKPDAQRRCHRRRAGDAEERRHAGTGRHADAVRAAGELNPKRLRARQPMGSACLSRHWSRIAVTLVPLVFALLHAGGVVPIGVLQRLDDIIYDARLRATMPRTLDARVVIVDIDEKSLAEVGRWPWAATSWPRLVDELFDRQKVALVGFDVVFAEPDDSSGPAAAAAAGARAS